MTFGDAAYYRRQWLHSRRHAGELARQLEQLHDWQLEGVEGVVRCPHCTEHHTPTVAQAVWDELETLRHQHRNQGDALRAIMAEFGMEPGSNVLEIPAKIRDLKKQLYDTENRARLGWGRP